MPLLIPIGLILLGLLLLAVEVYVVPGVNVVGVAGVLAVAGGVAFAFFEGGLLEGLVALAGAGAAGGALFTWLWQSGAWSRFVLAHDLRSDPDEEAARQDSRARLIGQVGVALSPLRPTGVAEIGGERVEVRTEGAFIAAGSRIRVVAMDRRCFFVRLAEEAQSRTSSASA
ncbi:MAG TPA: NfeD family protein [Rubricoccaceae bacterium]|nr:NfeD family protein [Rubricoccaceae bacterium]